MYGGLLLVKEYAQVIIDPGIHVLVSAPGDHYRCAVEVTAYSISCLLPLAVCYESYV